MRSLATAALVAALPLASANAEIIRVEYEATLDANPEINWPAGVVMTSILSYDSEVQPTIVDARAIYPVLQHRMTLDGTLFSGNNTRIKILNDYQITLPPLSPVYRDELLIRSPVAGEFNGFAVSGFSMHFFTDTHGSFGGPLRSLALPTTEGELGGFDWSLLSVSLSGEPNQVFGSLTHLEVRTLLAAECNGFAAPFDVNVGLSRKEQRVIPLRMTLLDEEALPLGPADITAPTVSVSYGSGIGGGELEQLVESPGKPSSGNSFVWDEATQQWAFNLSTKPYTADGTYTVTAVAGDEDYVLSPACFNTFVRQ